MKEALLIGISKIFDLEEEQLLFSCRECDGLFHTSTKQKSEIIKCPNCKKKIEIKIEEKCCPICESTTHFCGECESVGDLTREKDVFEDDFFDINT